MKSEAIPLSSRNLAACEHAARVKTMLEALMCDLREDIREFDEPRAQVLFETAAEVLQGLHAAFDQYGREAGDSVTDE